MSFWTVEPRSDQKYVPTSSHSEGVCGEWELE